MCKQYFPREIVVESLDGNVIDTFDGPLDLPSTPWHFKYMRATDDVGRSNSWLRLKRI